MLWLSGTLVDADVDRTMGEISSMRVDASLLMVRTHSRPNQHSCQPRLSLNI